MRVSKSTCLDLFFQQLDIEFLGRDGSMTKAKSSGLEMKLLAQNSTFLGYACALTFTVELSHNAIDNLQSILQRYDLRPRAHVC